MVQSGASARSPPGRRAMSSESVASSLRVKRPVNCEAMPARWVPEASRSLLRPSGVSWAYETRLSAAQSTRQT